MQRITFEIIKCNIFYSLSHHFQMIFCFLKGLFNIMIGIYVKMSRGIDFPADFYLLFKVTWQSDSNFSHTHKSCHHGFVNWKEWFSHLLPKVCFDKISCWRVDLCSKLFKISFIEKVWFNEICFVSQHMK